MVEQFSIIKRIEEFISNNCQYRKMKPFISNLSLEDENSNELPILYDEYNSIQCIINISKAKKSILKEDLSFKETQVNIKDSSFELVIYKSDDNPLIIQCILVIIINDIEKAEQKKLNKIQSNLIDVNDEFGVLNNLRKFLFNYLKENKKYRNSNSNIIEKILLKDAINGVRFFNSYKNGIDCEDDNILKIIEDIKLIESKMEIKQKLKKNKDHKRKNDSDIIEIIEESNSNGFNYFQNELIEKYLDEMPKEIVNLAKKYKNITFTKEMFLKYVNDKNIKYSNNEDINYIN